MIQRAIGAILRLHPGMTMRNQAENGLQMQKANLAELGKNWIFWKGRELISF